MSIDVGTINAHGEIVKSISQLLFEKIEIAELEGKLPLDGSVVEKDTLVVEVIKKLANLPPNPLYKIVFCGGTCLSRAYGIIERMSEDIDFKLVLNDKMEFPSKSASRRELGNIAGNMQVFFEELGYAKEGQLRKSRDNNNFTQIKLPFKSFFDLNESLRSHIQVELIQTQMAHASVQLPVSSLADTFLNNGSSIFNNATITCVSLEEALAEKLVSFSRRLALFMSRHADDAGPEINLSLDPRWDQTLVRHLYDVHEIVRKRPDIVINQLILGKVVDFVVQKDAQDFKNQHSVFIGNEVSELLGALNFARGSKELRQQYIRLLQGVVYTQDPLGRPNFETALSCFETTLNLALTNAPSLAPQFVRSSPIVKM